jgi:hypothetical protein
MSSSASQDDDDDASGCSERAGTHCPAEEESIINTPPPKRHFEAMIKNAKRDLRGDPGCRRKAENLRNLMQQMQEFYDDDGNNMETTMSSRDYCCSSTQDSETALRKKRRLTLQESNTTMSSSSPSMDNIFFTIPLPSTEKEENIVVREIDEPAALRIATCKSHINHLAFSMDEKDFLTDVHTIETAMSICVHSVLEVSEWPKSKPFADGSSMILFSSACFSVACKFCQSLAPKQMSFLNRYKLCLFSSLNSFANNDVNG